MSAVPERRRPGEERTARSTWGHVAGWSGRTLAAVVPLVFAAFFVIPVGWPLFAGTRSGGELARLGAFQPGSLGGLRANWHELSSVQDGAVTRWFLNSVGYAAGALVLTIAVSVPAGTRSHWPGSVGAGGRALGAGRCWC